MLCGSSVSPLRVLCGKSLGLCKSSLGALLISAEPPHHSKSSHISIANPVTYSRAAEARRVSITPMRSWLLRNAALGRFQTPYGTSRCVLIYDHASSDKDVQGEVEEHPKRTQRLFTEDSQRTRRGFAEVSQRIHREFKEDSQRTCIGFTEDSHTEHMLQDSQNSQSTHRGLTENSQSTHRMHK